MGALALSGLSVTWLLASTLAENNDLGMRAVLPAVMALTVLAAGALSRWMARPCIAAAACIAVIMVGLAGAVDLIRSYFAGEIQPAGREFAASPALWEAVRRHAAPDERVANNPLFLQDMTPWPDNISWGLLANRRSCYAGREMTLVYTALGLQRTDEVNAQFIRVFTGNPIAGRYRATRDDVRVPRYRADGCRRRLGRRSVCREPALSSGRGAAGPLADLPVRQRSRAVMEAILRRNRR